MAFTQAEFREATTHMEEINVKQARELMTASDKQLVFIGRETCGFCRRFLPKLLNVFNAEEHTLYFLDSTQTPVDEELADFRYELSIRTVPSLVYLGGEKNFINLNIDSSDSEESIAELLSDK